MGDVISSVFSGFSEVVGKLFGHPLDFLAGKSCNSICGPTWELICYIENFCISHLLKLGMVATLVYFVLLFFYLLYNLGICQCICHTICRVLWAFFATYFSVLHFCCTYLWYKLWTVKRRHRKRKRDIEQELADEEDYERSLSLHSNFNRQRSISCRRRSYKEEQLRWASRPTSNMTNVRFSGNSNHIQQRQNMRADHITPVNHILVSRSSTFVKKGSSQKKKIHHRRR